MLKKLAATTGDNEQVLEKTNILRKVGALAISAMEFHGAPFREGFEANADKFD